MLAVPLNRPDRVRDPPYLNPLITNTNFEKIKVTRFVCDTNCTCALCPPVEFRVLFQHTLGVIPRISALSACGVLIASLVNPFL